MSQIEPSIGPAPFITADMVLSSVQKMKLGKSPGGSNIIAEISKASPDQCNQLIPVLINAIVKEGKVPEEFNNRYMVSLFKGKGSTLQRGNCRGLKLTDHMLKLVERVTEKITRECIVIDDMQFGFMPGRGTTDAIFFVRQLQEKVLDKKNPILLPLILKRLFRLTR